MTKKPTDEVKADPMNNREKTEQTESRVGAERAQSAVHAATESRAAVAAADSHTGADPQTAPAAQETPSQEDKAPLTSAVKGEVLTRKRKKRHAKRKRRLRIALIIVLVLALVAAICGYAAWNMYKTGEENLHSEADNIQTSETAVTYDEGYTIEHNGHTYQYNENIVSVCIIGYDRRTSDETAGYAGQADAVMVLALDTETGKATAIGIPRDSMVDVGEYVGEAFLGMDTMQLCLAFSYGDGGQTSCEYTTTIAQRTLYNMPISYYFALDMEGIGPLANAIGGVALTPLQSIPNTIITEGQATVLLGDNALKYVQWRDTSVLSSSLDRQERQIQFIQAYASQALSSAQGDVSMLLDLFNTAQEYSVTNLGASEFTYLASCLLSNGITSLDVTTLDGEMVQGDVYAEFYLDSEAVYQTVLNVYYNQID